MEVAVRRSDGRTKQDARVETAESSLAIALEERTLAYLFKINKLISVSRTRSLDPAGPTHRVEPREDKVIFGSASMFEFIPDSSAALGWNDGYIQQL